VGRHINWRAMSGVEMTWVLYDMYVQLVPEPELRRFYRSVNDVAGERAMDAGAFKDGDL
jgi:hypothetical protein